MVIDHRVVMNGRTLRSSLQILLKNAAQIRIIERDLGAVSVIQPYACKLSIRVEPVEGGRGMIPFLSTLESSQQEGEIGNDAEGKDRVGRFW